ncbi:hypothetical protein BKA57DRAFT_75614 [Linnemannia elongata]|nr:hypothetical protein BKA57DRAFT_75614 [Linnemannia elongata]
MALSAFFRLSFFLFSFPRLFLSLFVFSSLHHTHLFSVHSFFFTFFSLTFVPSFFCTFKISNLILDDLISLSTQDCISHFSFSPSPHSYLWSNKREKKKSPNTPFQTTRPLIVFSIIIHCKIPPNLINIIQLSHYTMILFTEKPLLT